MNQRITGLLPTNDHIRMWLAVGINAVIAGILTVWGIYSIEEYGSALFVLTPFFMGAGPVLFYGLKNGITKRKAFTIGLFTLGIYSVGLILCAVEGLICIAMAAPFGIALNFLGSMTGFYIINRLPHNVLHTWLLLLAAIPSMAFLEKDIKPTLKPVVTSVDIDADPHTVWQNVVTFNQMEAPTEFIFKIGIAYPINATIQGTGAGAVRHCNFSTGSFVEPIVVWDEPRLLQFEVVAQPAPMKELSIYNIHPPHLHGFFVSKKGQFKLTSLPGGRTHLEGTTWYYHDLKPFFYWRLWSDYIIHKIHRRVLLHIKKNAESTKIDAM